MPNVLRRFLAMTARVPIIHVADTAFTIGQGAREEQPRHHHWPPGGCLRGLDYEPSTSQLRGSGRHVDGEAASDQIRDHAARSVADDAIHLVRPLLEEISHQAGQPRDVTVRPEPDIRCRAAVRPDVLDIPRPAPRRVHDLARPSRPIPSSPSAHMAPGHHPTASALVRNFSNHEQQTHRSARLGRREPMIVSQDISGLTRPARQSAWHRARIDVKQTEGSSTAPMRVVRPPITVRARASGVPRAQSRRSGRQPGRQRSRLVRTRKDDLYPVCRYDCQAIRRWTWPAVP